jgi:predicted hydrolase (HD superfamily)
MDIYKGAEELGVNLDDHMAFVAESLKAVAGDLGLV